MEIPSDSPEEVEIRANTIWAVEYMRLRIAERTPNINALMINDQLWLAGQEKRATDKPYHLTRTTAY